MNDTKMVSGSFAARFWQYMKERFPLQKNGVLLLLIFSAIYTGTTHYFKYVTFIAGAAAYVLFALHLRLMDEFKDFKADSEYRPYRPVQRGLVTLKELGLVMAVLIAIELILSALTGFLGFIFFTAAILYSFLMWKEFFIGKFLGRHMYLYALSHGVVTIPLTCFAMLAALGLNELSDWGFFISGTVIINIIVFCATFSFEIARKIKRKEEEVDGIETYTSHSGEVMPVILLIILNCIMGILAVQFGGVFFMVLTVAYAVGAILYVLKRNMFKKGEFMEILTGAYVLVYFIALNVISLAAMVRK